MIVGPANCDKTSLFSPLTCIFATFANLATTSYAWLGVEDAEIILFNNVHWGNEVFAWIEPLLLLEGQAIHFPAPQDFNLNFVKGHRPVTNILIFFQDSL